jgi:hypothetical protein
MEVKAPLKEKVEGEVFTSELALIATLAKAALMDEINRTAAIIIVLAFRKLCSLETNEIWDL